MAGVQTTTVYKSINKAGVPPRPPPPVRTKLPPTNKPSLLLSKNENRMIVEALGRDKRTLATAVASILIPLINRNTGQPSSWHSSFGVVVVCLVRDAIRRSYFIEAVCMRSSTIVFYQELYNEFQYEAPKDTLLTFEGDGSMVGILFADPCEAFNWREALDLKLEAMALQRGRSMSSSNNGATSPPGLGVMLPESTYGMGDRKRQPNHDRSAPSSGQPKAPNSKANSSPFLSRAKKGKKKTKLTSRDIGTPMDFRHRQHVGFDPNKGFKCQGLDDKNLKAFLDKAGISDQQLQDEPTRKFIFNFIEQNGGVEMVKGSNFPNDDGMEMMTTPTPTPEPGPPPPPPPPPSISGSAQTLPVVVVTGEQKLPLVSDDRSKLLQQIQDGFTLKPLKKVEAAPKGGHDELAEALINALIGIRDVLSSSDEEEGHAIIGDDEWSD